MSVSTQSQIFYSINDTVTIQCNITLTHTIGPNTSPLVVNWFNNNEMREPGHTTQTGESSIFISSLNLTQIKITDAGQYNCSATISGSSIIEMNSTALCWKGIDLLICGNTIIIMMI